MKINPIQTFPSCALMAQRGPLLKCSWWSANGHWSLSWRTVYENSVGWSIKAQVGGKNHTVSFLYWESSGLPIWFQLAINMPTLVLLSISPSERNRPTTALYHVTHTHPTQVVWSSWPKSDHSDSPFSEIWNPDSGSKSTGLKVWWTWGWGHAWAVYDSSSTSAAEEASL